MNRKLISISLILLLALTFAVSVGADEEKKAEPQKSQKSEYDYIGVKKCALKPCHGNDGKHESWLTTKHATAWDDLSEEDKKNEDLLKYYTTGTTKKGDLLYNVQCEACHGPGSGYKSKKVMEDVEAAMAKGLVIPTEETCKGCHNEKAPAALAAIAKDFDFEKLKAKGVHAMKEKKE